MSSIITSVTPCDKNGTPTGTAVTNVPAPSVLRWSKMDISAPNAGRVASMKMLKMMKGKARTLEMEWWHETNAQASTILKIFDYEYVNMTFHDLLDGTNKTAHMYMGDMFADCYTFSGSGVWSSVKVTAIQATPDGV